MKAISTNGDEFEVTEADMALVAPLGQLDDDTSDEDRLKGFADLMKGIIQTGGFDRLLPRGIWDAFIDEGDWRCTYPGCGDAPHCGVVEHQVLTRMSEPERDDVFVRLPGSLDTPWDLEVMTRTDSGQAYAAIQGSEYPPEDCIKDLAALLAVFRLYVQQGKI